MPGTADGGEEELADGEAGEVDDMEPAIERGNGVKRNDKKVEVGGSPLPSKVITSRGIIPSDRRIWLETSKLPLYPVLTPASMPVHDSEKHRGKLGDGGIQERRLEDTDGKKGGRRGKRSGRGGRGGRRVSQSGTEGHLDTDALVMARRFKEEALFNPDDEKVGEDHRGKRGKRRGRGSGRVGDPIAPGLHNPSSPAIVAGGKPRLNVSAVHRTIEGLEERLRGLGPCPTQDSLSKELPYWKDQASIRQRYVILISNCLLVLSSIRVGLMYCSVNPEILQVKIAHFPSSLLLPPPLSFHHGHIFYDIVYWSNI